MPVSSTPSKRVALAPININLASPVPGFKSRPLALGLLPLTPSRTPKLGLTKSASVLVPSSALPPARKIESFSEYKITNSRNVKADLAATKLKLRLQLAIYKLKLQRDANMASSPNIRVAKPLHSLTPRKSANGSDNINLQTRRRGPCLSSVASKKAGNLRLFHIKPLSSFHNSYPARLPLTSASQRLPSVHKILKTPIRTANRSFAALNADETIDESCDDTRTESRKKDDFLGSSPLRYNSCGTPNSFSVAKSLLQLGLGFY